MRAVRFHEFGAVDQLRVDDVPEPSPGPGRWDRIEDSELRAQANRDRAARSQTLRLLRRISTRSAHSLVLQ